jgi:hypothetical protein
MLFEPGLWKPSSILAERGRPALVRLRFDLWCFMVKSCGDLPRLSDIAEVIRIGSRTVD